MIKGIVAKVLLIFITLFSVGSLCACEMLYTPAIYEQQSPDKDSDLPPADDTPPSDDRDDGLPPADDAPPSDDGDDDLPPADDTPPSDDGDDDLPPDDDTKDVIVGSGASWASDVDKILVNSIARQNTNTDLPIVMGRYNNNVVQASVSIVYNKTGEPVEVLNGEVYEYFTPLELGNYSITYKVEQDGNSIARTYNMECISENEYDFNILIDKIEKLEQLSIQYGELNESADDPYIRVMKYIRAGAYTGVAWNMAAGKEDGEFAKYVAENQGDDDLVGLRTYGDFVAPNINSVNEKDTKIDFVHMMAVANVVCLNGVENNTMCDLAGWGGDLCQLIATLKTFELTGKSLQDKADELFNGDSTVSPFSSQDVLADIDAINISKIYGGLTSQSISKALQIYYSTLTEENMETYRKQSYYKSVFGEMYDGDQLKQEETIINDTISRMLNNSLINSGFISLFKQYSISATADAEEIEAAVTSFVRYFV